MSTPAELIEDVDIEIGAAEHKSDEKEDGQAELKKNEKRDFPDAFYDPTTFKLMKEPVVDVNGDSHEKSKEEQKDTFPNRALQEIIEQEVALWEQSFKGSLRRLDYALQKGWGRLVEQSAFAGDKDYRPLPNAFYCPILGELMADPLVTKEGVTYEAEAIEHWVRTNGISPYTRNPLSLEKDLRPNNALYELIQIEKGRTADSIHPSIRRWKETGGATSRRIISHKNNDDDDGLDPLASPPALASRGWASAAPPDAPPRDSLPTTQAEIDERQRRRRRPLSGKGILAITCATLAVAFFFFPYTTVWVLFYGIIVLIQFFPLWLCLGCACGAAFNECCGRSDSEE